MRAISTSFLISALAVLDASAQPLTGSATTDASSASTTPVCGQDFAGYTVSCGQTFSGSTVGSTTSKSSFQDCVSSCDSTGSCVAVSFVSGQCTLLSAVTDIDNADGAQAALKAAQASSVLPSIGSSIISSVAESISASEVPPQETTTTAAYSNAVADYLAQRLANNAPKITGADTQVYLTPEAVATPIASSVASSSSSSSLASSSSSSSSSLSASTLLTSVSTSLPPDNSPSRVSIKLPGVSPLLSNAPLITARAAAVTTKKTSAINTATTGAYIHNGGKRGLCYNDPQLTQFFAHAGQQSRVRWAYNWYLSESSKAFNPVLEYVPMLFNNDSSLLSQWPAAAKTAISKGATALMSMNEPDWCVSGSACMSVKDTVATYKKYMMPFAGKANLGAPAVTNAGSPYGLTYLQQFMDQCTGCRIDFINLHWYSNKYAGAAYFESYINSARKISRGKPIWITEFGLDNSYPYTDAELQSFLQTVMPWMDQQSDIARYAYFMDSKGILISSDGTSLSGTGAVFNSFFNGTKQKNLY
ncbi:hypothetical protein AAFC00_006164 [Neodothiora populina]|uniref:Asl1-like glycosyl hydrolase catalytic domain-containing protein n=1 Tax=Neodothiora populina TaxID=2781224 RepID=A0ABR3P488_9PEZI